MKTCSLCNIEKEDCCFGDLKGVLRGQCNLCRTAGNVERKFGLTPEAWNIMFEEQGGVCAICKNPETQNRRISVDHDHETGKVRGLLCNNCNRGLGLLKDSLHTLSSAVEYLKKSKE